MIDGKKLEREYRKGLMETIDRILTQSCKKADRWVKAQMLAHKKFEEKFEREKRKRR